MREMMNEEQKELEEKLPEYEKELKILLLPKDENDDKKRYRRDQGRSRWR